MQYDVHAAHGRTGVLLLNCQSDLHDAFDTRFVVPLAPVSTDLPPVSRLHPVFRIDDESWLMLTTQAATVSTRTLGPIRARLQDSSQTITAALDVLITGV